MQPPAQKIGKSAKNRYFKWCFWILLFSFGVLLMELLLVFLSVRYLLPIYFTQDGNMPHSNFLASKLNKNPYVIYF